jgi:hypothetical protein
VLGNRRVLFLLVPALLALVYYNLSFFRERNQRLGAAAPARVEIQPALAVRASPALPVIPVPSSYEEGLARLAPLPASPLPPAGNRRDPFWRTGDDGAIKVATATPPPAAAAAAAIAVVKPGQPALRFEGWVATPEGDFAIVNGRLASDGTSLPGAGRVLRIARDGVVVSTEEGVKVLHLASEAEQGLAPAPATPGKAN